ncbi:MAG: NTPase [Nitrospinae bacterium]|nr:NTPase [Nitrospinota bacterium]
MDLIKKNILITGVPGIGKTTLINKISDKLKDYRPVGFFTTEIREKGIRKGFDLISLDGRRGILSHTGIKSPYRVGKYKVDVRGFEDFLDSIPFFAAETNLIIIDEIGKMECLSDKFKNLVRQIFDSDKLLIATIALKGEGFVADLKNRGDIKIFDMTYGNRDSLLLEILKAVSGAG